MDWEDKSLVVTRCHMVGHNSDRFLYSSSALLHNELKCRVCCRHHALPRCRLGLIKMQTGLAVCLIATRRIKKQSCSSYVTQCHTIEKLQREVGSSSSGRVATNNESMKIKVSV